MASNKPLTRADLWSLEDYSERRADFRAEVMAHKQHRKVALGPHATLYFEDALTMKYQIQEMLRVEKIFSKAGIEEELAAYNPLVPDGTNWKATFMIEYADAEERRVALNTMAGIEHRVWVAIHKDGEEGEEGEKIYAIANEDMDRSTDEKAAAVHFMRFELSPESIARIKAGGQISMGIDHQALPYVVTVEPATADSLAADLGSL
jgi:hypothetical protein